MRAASSQTDPENTLIKRQPKEEDFQTGRFDGCTNAVINFAKQYPQRREGWTKRKKGYSQQERKVTYNRTATIQEDKGGQ